MKQKIYIPLPRNISFSVFEALKLHEFFFENLGKEVIYFSRNKKIEQNTKVVFCKSIFETMKLLRQQKAGIIYCITVNEVLLSYFANLFTSKKEIIFWVQGLIDDEDYLSNNNKLRYIVFNKLFKLCLRISTKLVVVTDHMFEVLKTKYKCTKDKPRVVIPCKSRLKYNGAKKISNSLCYIGGLSKWQNVDKTLKFYNELSNVNNKYKLFIATFDFKSAYALIEENVDKDHQERITLVSVSSATEVEEFLSTMEYGFLIRDDIPLNNVASPIKLAEYLSCGVTPIISTSLKEFYNKLNKHNCGVFIESSNYYKAIDKLIKHHPSTENTINSYNSIYEPDNLTQNLKKFLDK